jgi:hypothetical protein
MAKAFDPSVDSFLADTISEANRQKLQQLTREFSGSEIKAGLLNQDSAIYKTVADTLREDFAGKLNRMRDKDGELPPVIPPALRNEEAYIDYGINQILQTRAAMGMESAPTGISRDSIQTGQEVAKALPKTELSSPHATELLLGELEVPPPATKQTQNQRVTRGRD